jgi:hypothetical protein
MADPLDEYLAQQADADLAGWDEHVKHRHELRAQRGRRPQDLGRDRATTVAELERGSEELDRIDSVLGSGQADDR